MSLEPFLPQAEQPQFSQSFLIAEVLHPSDHLHGPPLDLLHQAYVLLMSHFFACFLDAVENPSPVLHGQLLVMNASHWIFPHANGLASCQVIHLELAGVAHRVLKVLNFGCNFFPLQHLKFPAVKSQGPFLLGWE